MVVLVRCNDNTCSVALKSRIDDLADEGLITAVLRDGEWIAVERTETWRLCKPHQQSKGILAPIAAPL